MVIPIIVGALETVPQRFRKDIEATGDQRKNRNHLHYRTVKITLTIKRSIGELS